jgi:hypothetical protein
MIADKIIGRAQGKQADVWGWSRDAGALGCNGQYEQGCREVATKEKLDRSNPQVNVGAIARQS